MLTAELDAFKAAAADEIHSRFAPLLSAFRFVPTAERSRLANETVAWARALEPPAPRKVACAVFLQGTDRFIAEDHAAALNFLLASRTIFAEESDSDGLGLTAMMIGAIYRTLGNFDLALKILWEGHELLKASGRYPVFLAANANSLANIEFELGHLDDAVAMFRVTRDESEKAGDFYFLIYGLHGLGRTLAAQGNRTGAEAMFREALAAAEKSGHPLQISNSLTELATLAFDAGDLAEAETLTRQALQIRESHNLLAGAVTNCLRLSEIQVRRGETSPALATLDRALAIATKLNVKPKLAQVHRTLAEVHERAAHAAAGEARAIHFTEALANQKRYHALRDEVEREDSARKLADARVVFEAEQTKKENAIIRAQKLEIERKNSELQDTIDELTRAKIGRKAKAMTLMLAVVLFIFQDAILGSVIRALANASYVELLVVKMAIIFSLAPINQGIERYLLRRVRRSRQVPPAALPTSPSPPSSATPG